MISRGDFVAAIGSAVRDETGYAAGKIGVSELAWLLYPLLVESGAAHRQLRAFEVTLKLKATAQSGLFPAEPAFYREFAEFYGEQLRQSDCIGVVPASFATTAEVVRRYRLGADLLPYKDQEPDRSTPADDSSCYLPHLAGKRVLIVTPFAEILRERATKETFEAVWAKTGKRWFEPAAVDAIEFPYGFARTTQQQYGTCLDLLDVITGRMAEHDFDVALIGAGALGIPLAAAARARGKVGISLGGALQVIFGVLGERWRERESWQRRYITDAWIDMPAEYRPEPSEMPPDGYW
jgi:hypothetical protein